MTVLFFGTYDRERHPRITALMQGFEKHGDTVIECNVPLGDSTRQRVAVLQRPWLSIIMAARIALAWGRLVWRARRTAKPQVVIVGYMGQLDVHLARRLWPDVPVALDYLISLADTARDRRASGALLERVLQGLDTAALRTAHHVLVDTEEHRSVVAPGLRDRALVVPVGAPEQWFTKPDRRPSGRLRVVFFGLFTPLQGTDAISQAIANLAAQPIDFVMIGTGQDYGLARRQANDNPNVTWIDWVDSGRLPGIVASHDVCLGIFGTGPKAQRVVPNKVFQGAAAGCAVVTSDTPPQRHALGNAGVLVPAGSPEHLAEALLALQRNPSVLLETRIACHARARKMFTPESVVTNLRRALETITRPSSPDRQRELTRG